MFEDHKAEAARGALWIAHNHRTVQRTELALTKLAKRLCSISTTQTHTAHMSRDHNNPFVFSCFLLPTIGSIPVQAAHKQFVVLIFRQCSTWQRLFVHAMTTAAATATGAGAACAAVARSLGRA